MIRRRLPPASCSMDASSLLMLIAFGGASFGAAATGAIFRPGEWYRQLDKPRWRPPDWLFAPSGRCSMR